MGSGAGGLRSSIPGLAGVEPGFLEILVRCMRAGFGRDLPRC